MDNWMRNLRNIITVWGPSVLMVIVPLVIFLVLIIICIITLVRLCKVLGKVQGFFEELEANGTTLAQVTYAKAVSLKTIAETSNDIADEIEGVKVVTEAIGYEDMSIYEEYKKGCN